MRSFDDDTWDLNDSGDVVSVSGGMGCGCGAAALWVILVSCTVGIIVGMG